MRVKKNVMAISKGNKTVRLLRCDVITDVRSDFSEL